MQITSRSEIMPGVFLTSVRTDKFKTNLLRAAFVRPLHPEETTYNALIPMILRRGSEAHPDMESVQEALDDMYGARLEPFSRKKGEAQCFGFAASAADDRYVPEGGLLERAAALMGEVMLRPRLENGVFCGEYLSGEAKILADRIDAQVNNKGSYAKNRLIETMCQNEGYGINVTGSKAVLETLRADLLYKYYQTMLTSSRLELFYCGSAEETRVKTAFLSAFGDIPRGGMTSAVETVAVKKADSPREVTEKMDVTQGKLCIGFRTGIIDGDPDYPALYLFAAVYGAGAASKLFMNVRERLSLCYYASAAIEGIKGVMIVQSGVDFDKMDAARDEILAQLEHCKNGDIEPAELEGARETLLSDLMLTRDSQGAQEEYYLGRAVSGHPYEPEEFADKVRRLIAADVARAAGKITVDTVYYLRGVR